MHPLSRLVARSDLLNDEEALKSYAGDASPLRGEPDVVLRPRNEHELHRIILRAHQYRLSLVPRGTGIGRRGGTVLAGGCVVHLHHFNRIQRLDRQLSTVDVEAGVTLDQLSRALQPYGLGFGLRAEPLKTLGGLAAINTVTEDSFALGDMREQLVWVEAFDGAGRKERFKGARIAEVVGKEGSTGIITRMRVKLRHNEVRSLELEPTDDPIRDADAAAGAGATLIELCSPTLSALLGQPHHTHLLVGYPGYKGSIQNVMKIEEVLRRYRQAIWSLGEDVTVTPEAAGRLVEHLDASGHLGAGILLSDDSAFVEKAVSYGATPGGKYGYGRTHAPPEEVRKEVVRLKERRDYNGILNPGVLGVPSTPDRRAVRASARRTAY